MCGSENVWFWDPRDGGGRFITAHKHGKSQCSHETPSGATLIGTSQGSQKPKRQASGNSN